MNEGWPNLVMNDDRQKKMKDSVWKADYELWERNIIQVVYPRGEMQEKFNEMNTKINWKLNRKKDNSVTWNFEKKLPNWWRKL